jgi:hypothetical protein
MQLDPLGILAWLARIQVSWEEQCRLIRGVKLYLPGGRISGAHVIAVCVVCGTTVGPILVTWFRSVWPVTG